MYEICIMLLEFLKLTQLTVLIQHSINVKVIIRFFARLNIASEMLKMEREKSGEEAEALCVLHASSHNSCVI